MEDPRRGPGKRCALRNRANIYVTESCISTPPKVNTQRGEGGRDIRGRGRGEKEEERGRRGMDRAL